MGGLLKNDAEQDMAKGDNDESELSVISLGCWASQLCHQVGIKPGPKVCDSSTAQDLYISEAQKFAKIMITTKLDIRVSRVMQSLVIAIRA